MKQIFSVIVGIFIAGLVSSLLIGAAMAGVAVWLDAEYELMLTIGTSIVATIIAFDSLELPFKHLIGWFLGTCLCLLFSILTYLIYIGIMCYFGYGYSDGFLLQGSSIECILGGCLWGSLMYLIF